MTTRPRFTLLLDSVGTLLAAERIRRSARARKGKARGVLAVAIGLLLCLMPSAGSSDKAVIKKYVTYKEYAYYALGYNSKEFKCLDKLYTKESNWNPLAKNGSHNGIPQGRSKYLATVDGYKQIQWGLDYIGHRYGEPCIALAHWKAKGWH